MVSWGLRNLAVNKYLKVHSRLGLIGGITINNIICGIMGGTPKYKFCTQCKGPKWESV